MLDEWDAADGISIHAPRVGSDGVHCKHGYMMRGFQSTLPVWGATQNPGNQRRLQLISIHAPRVGSDASFASAR